MSESVRSDDLTDDERRILLARHEQGFPPPPGMLAQHYMLVRELALTNEQMMGLRLDSLDNESEPETLRCSIVGEPGTTTLRAPPEGATTSTPSGEQQPSTSKGNCTASSGAELDERWEELAPQLEEVFRWRRETEQREDELFVVFEDLLSDAGTRGSHLTTSYRKLMEATKIVRKRGGDALVKARAVEEALQEERAALQEARRHQERSFAKAKEIQARVDAAREKRFAADGRRAPAKACCVCGLPGVHRGRECPNRMNHRAA